MVKPPSEGTFGFTPKRPPPKNPPRWARAASGMARNSRPAIQGTARCLSTHQNRTGPKGFPEQPTGIRVLCWELKREDPPVNTRTIVTNTSLIVVGLLVAQLPTASQGQKPAAAKTTTESGWYTYGKPYPDVKGPAPRLPNGKPSMAGLWSQTRRADV